MIGEDLCRLARRPDEVRVGPFRGGATQPDGRETGEGCSTPAYLYLALSAALAACGGGGAGNPDGGNGAGDGGDLRDRIVADLQVTFVAEAGTQALPIDVSDLELEAIVFAGDEVLRFPGAAEGGVVTFLEVPETRALLRIGDHYFDTERRRIDLGFARLGRASARPLSIHTPVQFVLAGLESWESGDRLELFAPNSGLVESDLAEAEPGATDLDATIDLFLAEQPREVDGSVGDVMYIHQLATRLDAAGNQILEIAASYRSDEAVAITSGEPATVEGELDALALDRALTVSWTGTAYAELAAGMGPLAPAPSARGARLVATPVESGFGVVASYPTLASTVVADDLDQEIELAFTSPLPGHWNELEIDFLEVEAELEPGGPSAIARATAITGPGRLEAGAAPALGPPTDVEIAGRDATNPLAEVGLTPAVQWSPPLLGVAGGYEIDVHRVEPRERVATVSTTRTAITLPEPILEAGERYYLEIRAIAVPSSDLAAAPLRRSIPVSTSEIVTAPFSP
jgi:hypothetical protein